MTLFIDACARKASRTRALGEYLLQKLGDEVQILRLCEETLPRTEEALLTARDGACASEDFSGEAFRLARQFSAADTAVIAAPFWDLSFPAVLKDYLEAVSVTGLTFRYSEEGIPVSLCRLKRLYYVTTSGGPIFDASFSFGYVSALAKGYFGAEETAFFSAQGLDLRDGDPEAVLAAARREMDLAPALGMTRGGGHADGPGTV